MISSIRMKLGIGVPIGLVILVVAVLVTASSCAAPSAGQHATRLLMERFAGDPGAPGPGLLQLVSVDPATLEPGAPAAGPGFSSQWLALSADGSTLVTIEDQPGHEFVVIRDAGGNERLRFDSPGPLALPRLSRDGSRLVVQDRRAQASAATWYLLDTSTGRELAQTTTPNQFVYTTWIDPGATHLYVLILPGSSTDAAPHHVAVAAYDLVSGAKYAELALPDMVGGWWSMQRTLADGAPALAQMIPGAALSPNGRTLALLDCDAQRAIMLALPALTVESTVTFRARNGWLAWLPFWPQIAHAKGPAEGTNCRASFSADGHYLYSYGSRSSLGPDDKPRAAGLGIQALDVSAGTVAATALPGATLSTVLASPDGSVYAAGPTSTDGNSDWRLRRLDGSSLGVLAERPVSGYFTYVLVADSRTGQ